MFEKKVHVDKNHFNNKIKNARIPDVPILDEHDEDAINRKYVDKKSIYSTELSKKNIKTSSSVGGINSDTNSSDLNGKTINEILDNAFFGTIISYNYTLPTTNLSINTDDLILNGGFQQDVIITANTDKKDSKSIISYSWSGTGITGIITTTKNFIKVLDVIMLEKNEWNVVINYDESIIVNDNIGNPIIGNYPSGSITDNIDLITPYPILTSVNYDSIDTSSFFLIDFINDMDTIKDFSDMFNIEVGVNDKYNISFAIPSKYDIMVEMDELDVTNAFELFKTNIKPWGVGDTVEYSVYIMSSDMGIETPTTLKVNLFEKYYNKIYDVTWDSIANTITIDNDIVYNDANVLGACPFSISSNVTNTDIVIESKPDVGFIKRIEMGKPFLNKMLIDNIGQIISLNNIKGIKHRNKLSTVYKFRIWTFKSYTDSYSTKIR